MRDKAERIQQRTAHLHRVIKNNVARCRKKIELQNKELEKAKDAKQYRLFGELIISNIHQISTGTKQVTLLNFYSPDNSMITILLIRPKHRLKMHKIILRCITNTEGYRKLIHVL